MELNLRQAANLLRDIDKKIEKLDNDIPSTPTLNVSPFNSIDKSKQLVAESIDKFVSAKMACADLLQIKFTIRALIADANHQSGINQILNTITVSKKLIALYSVGAANEVDWELIETKFSKQTAEHGGFNEVRVNSLNQNVYDNFEALAKTKSQLVKNLSDKLIVLNINTKVTLSSEIVEKLTKFSLL